MTKNVVAGLYAITVPTGSTWKSYEPNGPIVLLQAIGIPDIDGNVPSAIMPTLPTAAAQISAFPYNPKTLSTPVFADGASQYMVDSVAGNDGAAGNSGRGSVDLPRETLPGLSGSVWTIGEADQIFIKAGSAFWDDDDITVNVSGTSGSQAWIIGYGGQPQFNMDKFFMGGTHILIDNIHFKTLVTNEKTRIKFGNDADNLSFEYGTIRNCTLEGNGIVSAGTMLGGEGNGSSNPTQFICIYNNTIIDVGDWTASSDHHGIQPVGWTRYWWIEGNEIARCGADAIQVSNSASSGFNNFEYEKRPHYIYIGGNHLHHNGENEVDNKNSYHIIFSGNLCHDNTDLQGGSILLANDSEGPLSSYQWGLNNIVYNSILGCKIASNVAETVDDPDILTPVQTAGQKVFLIGNLFYNISDLAIELDARGGTGPQADPDKSDLWYERIDCLLNTVVATNTALDQTRVNSAAGESATVNIIGNISVCETPEEDHDWNIKQGTAQTNNFNYNFMYRPSGSVNIDATKLDSNVGNTEDVDPEFIDTGSADYRLDTGSQAIDITGFSELLSALTLFNDMYGIDIAKDLDGVARPQNTLYDAGAYES